MQSNRVPALIRWWVTPKLPKEHIFISPESRPKKLIEIIRVYMVKWLVHPMKRRIARYYLLFLQKFCGLTVVAITGSAGKTTTKEMIASILSRKGETIATYKNIDSVYNIPTTIFKCRPSTKYLVLEMGVEFPGEMDFYLWLAKPKIGVVTNIYPTHTQFLGSIQGVAKEKIKLIKALPRDGFAVLNSENPIVKEAGKETKAKVIWYGKGGSIRAENPVIMHKLKNKYTLSILTSRIDVQLPIIGAQFVSNSLAAASVGHVCGVEIDDIKLGLARFSPEEHRMKVINHTSGAIILDDSYNNNPEAAKEALNTLNSVSVGKKKIVVFGDMLELGRLEAFYHRKIGSLIASMGIDFVLGVGDAAKMLVEEAKKTMDKTKVAWVRREAQAYSIIVPKLTKNCVILVKGSRSIGLDKLVKRLSV